ncbi:hypothetical protein [Aneurinibacillus tyrosinisolvens]|uniref:hypothetical protein n=1 Tax=Aneurinibacillus tyrosinisolvens TaxID=1443435 RepID=UPI0006996F17|nr:hypothetical protein [Aneurinibacillus tyrosinisolvens]
MAILLKNVKTRVIRHQAEITIDGKKTIVDLDKLHISPSDMSYGIGFGGTRFEVINNQLISCIDANMSISTHIGAIVITYEFKDNMYQAKKSNLKPQQPSLNEGYLSRREVSNSLIILYFTPLLVSTKNKDGCRNTPTLLTITVS